MPFDMQGQPVRRTAGHGALDVIFRNARTPNGWKPEPVDPALLEQIYSLARLGPTSANSSPLRIVFVVEDTAKERLKAMLAPANVDKTMAAPCTAIMAGDPLFYQKAATLFPDRATLITQMFGSNDLLASETCHLNAVLQAGYFILAARSLGLDCGPMSGFDRALVDREFLAGYGWQSLFLCNLGYGTDDGLFPRNPRLAFDEACVLV